MIIPICSHAEKYNYNFSDVLFSDKSRDVLYYKAKQNYTLFVAGDVTPELVKFTDSVFEEIGQITDGTVQISFTRNIDDADIFLVFSANGNKKFEDEYANLFEYFFGKAAFDYYDGLGAFLFPFNPQNPCFGFGLYDPDNFEKSNYVRQNSPMIGVISIGNIKNVEEAFLSQCLREEIAHLVFYIPDFEIKKGSDSIFNSNVVHDERNTYSDFDRSLMYYMAKNPRISGMTKNEFDEYFLTHPPE